MPRYTIYIGDNDSRGLEFIYDQCDVSDITDDGIAITCKSGRFYRFVDDGTMSVSIMIRTDKKRRYMHPANLNLILERKLRLWGLNEDIEQIKKMIGK